MSGRLTKIEYEGSTVATFEYDELSRRTLLTLGNDANRQVYTYDEIYRLTNVDYNDSNSTSYTYDSLGNRTDVNDGSSTSYSRNELNQYTSVGGTSYSYDSNGNLTDDNTYLYYYDSENRLTEIKNNGGGNKTIAKYYYDFKGRRTAKELYKKGRLDTTTKYCYDGDRVIAEYDDNDNLLRKFVYGPSIDEPIMMIDIDGESEVKYYYHLDGLGSVVALSDTSTSVAERYSYKVFGEPNTTSSVGNPYLFTGRRYDPEAGLYYYRARYYAHDLGRFLQPDPIRYTTGSNLYTYCGNNPISRIDPSGLWPEEGHQALGERGNSDFDYARLDRDYSPHSRHWRRHFRNREDVILDLEDACQRGDARDFELHMHELQDTYSHGRGLGGGLSHLWHRNSPDDITLHQDAYNQADRATRFWERMWDRYNPPEQPTDEPTPPAPPVPPEPPTPPDPQTPDGDGGGDKDDSGPPGGKKGSRS